MQLRKACFFLPSANRDGAELSGLECMDALKALGLECHAVLPRKGPLLADLTARGISCRIIPYQVWVEPPAPVWKRLLVTGWNLLMTYGAAFLVGRRQGDLIITNTINICVGALVARLHGIPHVWYIREFGAEDHGWRFHLGAKPSLWFMNRMSLRFIAVSRAVAQKYRAGMAGAKVHAVYQPIEVDPFGGGAVSLPREPFQITAVIVGRLQAGKRQEDAIRAVAALREQGVRAQLWVVGGGDEEYAGYLQGLVREHGLSAQVRFLGQVANAFPYIQQADVLILCSRCEAFARVVVEAMKAGKPVLGSRSGGTVEQIKDGVNGFLYEPGNYGDLAAKITYLVHHPREAREMGENGRKWAMATFTRERYREKLAGILAHMSNSSP
jgi:glycosyltransferase involved in cell wall biosynthesis